MGTETLANFFCAAQRGLPVEYSVDSRWSVALEVMWLSAGSLPSVTVQNALA